MSVTFLTNEDKTELEQSIGQLSEEIDNQTATNSLIIAHRGYHVDYPQNSYKAIEEAINKGFGAVELDIHRCKDGVYILAHDSTITLYDNGVAKQLVIWSVNYKDIATYTLDPQSNHLVCTLQSALAKLRNSGVKVVLDKKSGNNAEIMKVVSATGMTNNVIMSYYTTTDAIADKTLHNRYKNVPMRVVPTNYNECLSLMSERENPIYADINASSDAPREQYLNVALSCGLPIIFAGCTTSNAKVWAGVAHGCMAEGAYNISVDEFRSILSDNYNIACSIVADGEVSVTVGEEKTLSVSSDNETPAGYVYAYSENPNVAKVTQTVFGNASTIKIQGVAEGMTNVHLFTPSGATAVISVTSGEIDSSDLIWKLGTIESNGHSIGSTNTRMSAVKAEGTFKSTISSAEDMPSGYDKDNMYLPTIPVDATTMTIPEYDSSLMVAPALFAGNGVRIADPGYGTMTINLLDYPEAKYYTANVRRSDNSAFSFDPNDTTGGYEAYLKVKAITDFIFT